MVAIPGQPLPKMTNECPQKHKPVKTETYIKLPTLHELWLWYVVGIFDLNHYHKLQKWPLIEANRCSI